MRKPDFCLCENKDADQLCGYREADQRLCFRCMRSTIILPKGVVTPKQKSLNTDLCLIAKNIFCLIDLLLFAQVNSYGRVGTLDVEREVKHRIGQTRIHFRNKTQVYARLS